MLTVHCDACGHQWDLQLRLPIPVERLVRAMHGVAAAGCPACGAHDDAVLCGPAPPLARMPRPEVQP